MYQELSARTPVLAKHRELAYRHVNGNARPSESIKRWIDDGIIRDESNVELESAVAVGIAIGEAYERRAVLECLESYGTQLRKLGEYHRGDTVRIISNYVMSGEHAKHSFESDDERDERLSRHVG